MTLYFFKDEGKQRVGQRQYADNRRIGRISRLLPVFDGEGDHTKCGGGVMPGARCLRFDPSTMLRMVPLPIASQQGGDTVAALSAQVPAASDHWCAIALASPGKNRDRSLVSKRVRIPAVRER